MPTWALVLRNGIAGLVPPPTHHREPLIRERAEAWKSKNKRAAGNARTKGIVDLLLDDLFVHKFLPLDHVDRLSKWCNFWDGSEAEARHFGYAVFSDGSRSRHFNVLPPRLVDERDFPLPSRQFDLTRWVTELQRQWNHGRTLALVNLKNVPDENANAA